MGEIDRSAAYEQHRERAAARQSDLSKRGRDIGPMPPVQNWRRRKGAGKSFRRFCEAYGKLVFSIKWSADHLRVIERLQESIVSGGQFCLAMPRGSGKTSLVAWAALWAILYGRRRMVVIVGADARASSQMLEIISGEIETNPLLLEDFPEVAYPFRRIEGIAQRASGQLCLGESTRLSITADELVLPTVPRDAVEQDEQMASAGSVVRTVGITGRIRGMQARLTTGEIVRPSLVLLDDPQTDESAKSPSQCDYRERIVGGAIMGLAGPKVKMSAIATVTVIRPDDLADRLLTPERHPDWVSERTKLVYEWGSGEELWRQYAEIRRDPDRGAKEATRFYRKNRKAMDAGSKVAWADRFDPGQISALQYAWDLRIDRGEDAFCAEYQNEPLPEQRTAVGSIDPQELLARLYPTPRGVVPAEASVLSAGIDVQGSCLYWLVAAWTDLGRGWIVDYGTFPQQPGVGLGLADVSVPLEQVFSGMTDEERIAAGCRATIELLSGDWKTESGGSMRVDRMLIDSGWGQHTSTVRSAVRSTRAPVNTSKGYAIGAKHTRAIAEGRRKPGERIGLNWRMTDPIRSGIGTREVMFDSNFWKTWVAARFRTEVGATGSLEICGESPADIRRHASMFRQFEAEESVLVEAKGRRVEEWLLRRPGLDNHLLDCLVLSAVAANIAGVRIRDAEVQRSWEAEDELSLASMQKNRRLMS